VLVIPGAAHGDILLSTLWQRRALAAAGLLLEESPEPCPQAQAQLQPCLPHWQLQPPSCKQALLHAAGVHFSLHLPAGADVDVGPLLAKFHAA